MFRWPKRRHRNVSTKSSHAKTIGAAKAHCPRQHTLHTRLSGGQCAALTFFHPPVAPNQILHRENDLPPRLLRSLGAPPRGRWVPMQISHAGPGGGSFTCQRRAASGGPAPSKRGDVSAREMPNRDQSVAFCEWRRLGPQSARCGHMCPQKWYHLSQENQKVPFKAPN